MFQNGAVTPDEKPSQRTVSQDSSQDGSQNGKAIPEEKLQPTLSQRTLLSQQTFSQDNKATPDSKFSLADSGDSKAHLSGISLKKGVSDVSPLRSCAGSEKIRSANWVLKRRDFEELLLKKRGQFYFWFFSTGVVGGVTAFTGVLSLSMMGYGPEVVQWILEVDPHVMHGARAFGLLFMLLLYMLDFFTAPHLRGRRDFGFCIMGSTEKNQFWTGVARGIFCTSLALAAAWCFLAVKSYPHYPAMVVLTAFIVMQVSLRLLYVSPDLRAESVHQLEALPTVSKERTKRFQEILVNHLLCQHDRLLYFKALTCSTLLISFIVSFVFSIWAFILPQNYWGGETRDQLREEEGVKRFRLFHIPQYGPQTASQSSQTYTSEGNPEIRSSEIEYNLQFNIWAAPAMLSLGYFLFFGTFFLRCKLHVAYSQSDELLDEIAQCFVDVDEERAHGLFGVGRLEKVIHTVKICVCCLLAIALGVWLTVEVSVGVSNSELNVSATVRAWLMAFAIVFTVFIVSSMHKVYRAMVHEMWRNPFLQMMVNIVKSDWMKAFLILPFWFLIPLYVAFSVINQSVRKCRRIKDRQNYHKFSAARNEFVLVESRSTWSSSLKRSETSIANVKSEYGKYIANVKSENGQDISNGHIENEKNEDSLEVGIEDTLNGHIEDGKDEDGLEDIAIAQESEENAQEALSHSRSSMALEAYLKRHLTSLCAHQISAVARWNIISVLGKSFIVGIVFFTLSIGATRGLNIVLIEVASILPENPWQTLFIWYGFGLIGFLLPPIPGPPIYLFGGLVCVGAFERAADDRDTGFITGIIVVIITAWILKLNACAVQQKCIGEPLGTRPWIRALVGVQKPVLRAVEVVLRQPGLSLGKCAILCGGPDWPVSVLCGILRCNLFQILLGTTPIVFFILPTVCAGAFQRRKENIFGTLTNIFYMFAAVMAIFFTVAMGYATQTVLDEHGPLLQIPLESNRELDWIDYKNTRKEEIYYSKTTWATAPMSVKVLWGLGFFLMSGSCWIFYMFPSDCFGDVESVLMQGDDVVEEEKLRLYYGVSEPPSGPEAHLEVQVIKNHGQSAFIAFLLSCLLCYAGFKILQHRVAQDIAEVEKGFPEEREAWEADLESKRDGLEREMRDFYPGDYELYLISTGRPRLPPEWADREVVQF